QLVAELVAQLGERLKTFKSPGVNLGVERQWKMAGRAADDEMLGLAGVGCLAMLPLQLGNVLVEEDAQLINGDDTVWFIAVLIGFALQAVEKSASEQSVVFEINRRIQAIGGHEDDAAGQRIVVLALVVAEELLVRQTVEVAPFWLGDRFLA